MIQSSSPYFVFVDIKTTNKEIVSNGILNHYCMSLLIKIVGSNIILAHSFIDNNFKITKQKKTHQINRNSDKLLLLLRLLN